MRRAAIAVSPAYGGRRGKPTPDAAKGDAAVGVSTQAGATAIASRETRREEG